ncbi:MAG: lipid II:glycine glycyltransferase FemX, partial [Patescibacteria group bacterium]
LYAPRGPIGSVQAREFLFKEFNQKNSGALFLRFEPLEFDGQELTGTKFFFRKTIDLQPAKTLILDLKQSEEELLKAMHQKTRYNIRLAEKKGIIIKESEIDKTGVADSADLKEFWRLLKTTGQRDNFRLHSFSHYEKLLEINKTRPGFIKLFLAQFEGKNIAAGIFSFYGNKVTYLHGASDNKFRNLMAPYLLQFSLIQKARAENYLYYDFYGIDEQKWPGVTRFKLGFGGRVFKYGGTYDLIFKPGFYRLYELFRKLRRLI